MLKEEKTWVLLYISMIGRAVHEGELRRVEQVQFAPVRASSIPPYLRAVRCRTGDPGMGGSLGDCIRRKINIEYRNKPVDTPLLDARYRENPYISAARQVHGTVL